jgi:hypothetical protein
MFTSRILLIVFGLLTIPHFAVASAPPLSVDAIVTRYVDAIGGRAKLDAIRNVVIRGSYAENGQSMPAVVARMRPFYKLVGDPLHRSSDFEEGYDGSAWEFYGDPGVVLRTVGPAAAAARHGLYILGNLVDYRKQGSSVSLVGMAKIANRNAWQLRVHMMDGFEQDEFVDAETFLIIADRKVAKIHAFGADVPSETRWSDYRRVNGVLLAFRNSEVETATGKELDVFQANSIEVNANLDASMFAPPRVAQAPVRTLIRQLYDEREDVNAVLWTLHDFRNAYPAADTDAALQVIGYQILKMGDVSSAIALLESNCRDYPRSSNAAFGLGRAYQSAGRTEDARRELQAALRLDSNNRRARKALTELSAHP